jgi:hypothetical protein
MEKIIPLSSMFWPRPTHKSTINMQQSADVEGLVEKLAKISLGEYHSTSRRSVRKPAAHASVRYCAPPSSPIRDVQPPLPFPIIPPTIPSLPAFSAFTGRSTFLFPGTSTVGKRKAQAMADEQTVVMARSLKRYRGVSPPMSTVSMLSSTSSTIFSDTSADAYSAYSASQPSLTEKTVETLLKPTPAQGLQMMRPTPRPRRPALSSEMAGTPMRRTPVLDARQLAPLPRRHNVKTSVDSYPSAACTISDTCDSSPALSRSGSSSPIHGLASLPLTPRSSVSVTLTPSPTISSFNYWSQEDWRSVMTAASNRPNELDFLAMVAQTEQRASAKAGTYDSLGPHSTAQPSSGVVQ